MKRSLWGTHITGLLFLFLILSYAASAGSVSLSVTELPDFREVIVGMRSDVQFYTVKADNIQKTLTIKTEKPFAISFDCFNGFKQKLELSPHEGSIEETTVYVRFFPEQVGDHQANISHQTDKKQGMSLVVTGKGTHSDIPEGYYATATANGQALKTALFHIINDHQQQTYASLWHHFQTTDATFNGKVWDIYSDIPCQPPPYLYTFVEDQDRGTDGNAEGQVFNREHSMPLSWYNGSASDPMFTDLFHIYPVDKWVNNFRGNLAYGEVDTPLATTLNGGKRGINSVPGNNATVFEPIDAYKGDLARTFLYMVTRYEDQVESWTYSQEGLQMLDPGGWQGYHPWAIDMLLRWHKEDPVSQKEIRRNNAVYQIQGNRNPFIDHPEFAERIWGEATSSDHDIHQTIVSVYPNPAYNRLFVSAPGKIDAVSLFSLCGNRILSLGKSQSPVTIELAGLIPGIYIIKVLSHQDLYQQKVILFEK